jgi:hypothetical protein
MRAASFVFMLYFFQCLCLLIGNKGQLSKHHLVGSVILAAASAANEDLD